MVNNKKKDKKYKQLLYTTDIIMYCNVYAGKYPNSHFITIHIMVLITLINYIIINI